MSAEDGVKEVSISSVKPHPENPRRGDVHAIAESLKEYGQYRPIVVSERTKHILAGNHTWYAAKRLKWKKISVTYVDVDAKEEKRIVLADNRIHELGDYDNSMLLNLLQNIGDIGTTGYDETDVDRLEGLFEDGEMFETEPKPGRGKERSRVVVGEYRMMVDQDVFSQWLDSISPDRDKEVIEEVVREKLNFAGAEPVVIPRTKKVPGVPEIADEAVTIVGHEMADIKSLRLFSTNPRQGDVGEIAKSLAINGQYRPLTVNQSTREILVGNHTWQAACALGWEKIAVTYIDVTYEVAQRIVLVDNRLADRGEYDDERLADLLCNLDGKWEGTGYTPEDVDDILHKLGRKEKEDISPNIKVAVGETAFKVPRTRYEGWLEKISTTDGALREEVCGAIINMLDLPSSSWVVSGQRDRKRDE